MGVSASHLDWTMVPYVRKSFRKHFREALTWVDGQYYLDNAEELDNFLDGTKSEDTSINDQKYRDAVKCWSYALDMTEKECHQAAEGLLHNLNTLQSRSGNQLPFSSVNLGSCTLPEGRMITRAILDVSIEGMGKLHKTSIFPCIIFQLGKGINRAPGDPNYDLYRLALKSTAKRLYPNYANLDVSMQMDWVEYDRKEKQRIIDNLSPDDKQKLIERLEENPGLAKTLMLEVRENE